MSRKTLKRIATNTVPSKKYVLGDVLGEGPLPRLPRRRASCLRRRGMAQEPTRTQRSPLPARLLCQLRAAAAGSPFGALTALIPLLCRGFWAGAGGHAGGRRRQVWAAGCCEDHQPTSHQKGRSRAPVPRFAPAAFLATLTRMAPQVRNGAESLKREIRCIKKVKHKNVIQLFDSIDEEENDKIYLVFELANLFSVQDLCELVRKQPIKDPLSGATEQALPIPYIRILFRQLVEGLQACHSKGVVHRDIKPSNLQLTSDGKLKIIDFGVAETLDRYDSKEITEKFAGTPSFQPPEVAGGNRSFSATKVDIWAAGVTLYYMVEGSAPFKGNTVDELYSTISEGHYKMPARVDDQLKEIIVGILQKDPDQRLTLDALVELPWCDISSLDIDLTEVLSELANRDAACKKSLMKRFMEAEDEDSENDDQESGASTAEEDIDVHKLDGERERLMTEGSHNSRGWGAGALGTEMDEVQKRNLHAKNKRMKQLIPADKLDACIVM